MLNVNCLLRSMRISRDSCMVITLSGCILPISNKPSDSTRELKIRSTPLSIRKDLIKVEKRDTKIAKYWARIPVSGRRGGVWVAIKPHQDIPDDVEICESKLFRRGSDFYLHLTIQKEIDFVKVETSDCVSHALPSFTVSERTVVMAIDIGEANPMASVELWGLERKGKT